jgi:hypothetical protein
MITTMKEYNQARGAFRTPVINTDNPIAAGWECLFLGGYSKDLVTGGDVSRGREGRRDFKGLGFMGVRAGLGKAWEVGDTYLPIPEREWYDATWMIVYYTPPGLTIHGDFHFGVICETFGTSTKSPAAEEDWFLWRFMAANNYGWFWPNMPQNTDSGFGNRSHMNYPVPIDATMLDSSPGPLDQGLVHTLICVRKIGVNSGRGRNFWNGVLQPGNGSNQDVSALYASTKVSDGCLPRLYLGRGVTRNWNGAPLLAFGMASRALDDSEVVALAENPLQLAKETGTTKAARRRLAWAPA